jgi:hypothetical protein
VKVAEHVIEAFRARLEVAFNGINYLREEKMLCRQALISGEIELYMHGYVHARVVGRMRREREAREASAPIDPTKTHAEKSYDEPSSTAVMWCGAVASLLDNGKVDPPELDFYIEPWGSSATCGRCLRARRKAKR